MQADFKITENNRPRLKAVLFDLDGTLVNSLGDLAGGVNFVLSEMGYPVHSVEEFKYFAGDGIPKMIERALPENARTDSIKKECVGRFLEYYSQHFADSTRLYHGIDELLTALKNQSMKIAVVSNKAQEMADNVVGKIVGNVDFVIGKREGLPAKPDPAALLLAAEKLGVDCRECVFLGDSGMDMAAAKNAGMLPIGVLWGFRTADELKSAGAKALISRPEELTEILKKRNFESEQ